MGAAVLFGRRLFVGVGDRVVASDVPLHAEVVRRLSELEFLSVVSVSSNGLPVLNLCKVFVESDS
jgi:hypothetical protein